MLRPYGIESLLCCQQELQTCQKCSVLGHPPKGILFLNRIYIPWYPCRAGYCLQAACMIRKYSVSLCLVCPRVFPSPLPPSLTVLFSLLCTSGHGCWWQHWFGLVRKRNYPTPRRTWKECCGVAPQLLRDKSTAAATSAKMRREIGCCLAHCSACLQIWIFKSYKSYSDMA